MLHTYNLFSVRVIHGKFIVPINIHKKIIKFVDENYIISNSMVSCVDGFQIHHDFDGKEELNKELNIHLNNTLNCFKSAAQLSILLTICM